MIDFFIPKNLKFSMSESKKKEGLYCCAYGCKNKPNKKKCGLCHKHYHRYRRMIDPVYDRYVNFKGNVKRPKIQFSITLQEFRQFCKETGYIIKKGMRGKNCTIDRIRNWEGYYIGNIQIKSNLANIRKYHDHDKHFVTLPEDNEDLVPF